VSRASRTAEPGPDMARLGAFIRAHRHAARLSMRALSEAAGVGESTMHRLEHGPATKTSAVKQPRAWNVAGVFCALGLSEDQVRPVVGRGPWGDLVARCMSELAAAADQSTGTSQCPVSDGSTVLRLRVPVGATVTVAFED
jgi:hypothetical protein